MKLRHPCLAVCASLTFLTASAIGQGFRENFDGIKADSPLESASGWSQENGAVVSGKAGVSGGNGLRLLQSNASAVYQPQAPLWSATDGPATFKIDFRFGGRMPVDITLHNGRTSAGFYVGINLRTHEISLSQGGGESVFRSEKSTHAVDGLKENAWYTLEIRDFQLSEAAGEPVVAKVYLYEAGNSANLLLDGISIASSGSIPFSVIKAVQIRRWGNAGDPFDVDNLELAKAPQR